MNKRRIGKEFEKEAYKLLKKKFDRVNWLSEYKQVSYDFECFKDNKRYIGEAKFLTNGKITLKFTQKDADFIIAKVNGRIIFLWKEEFGDEVRIERENKTNLTIQEDLKTRLNQLKYKFGYKTVDSVIRRLLEISSKLRTADELDAKSKEKNESTKRIK